MLYPQSPRKTTADVPLAFSLWYLSRMFEPELAEIGLLPDEPEKLSGGVFDLNELDEETREVE